MKDRKKVEHALAVVLTAVAGLAAIGCGPRVTFSEHIEPILQAKCQSCHRPGQVAPFSMLTYDETAQFANVIRTSIAIGNMPPFYAAGPSGYWKDDIRLTEEEKRLIIEWADSGAPEGDSDLSPEPLEWEDSEWPFGEPDMVLRFPRHSPPTNAKDQVVTFFANRAFSVDRWARALHLKTISKKAVHHSTVFLVDDSDEIPKARKSLNHRGRGRDGSLFTWFPGLTIDPLPEGQAIKLPAGKRIALRTHFGPTRERRLENLELGIYFAEGHVDRLQKQLGFQFVKQINIPPGESNYKLRGKRKIRADVEITHFRVHMHLRGKSSQIILRYPDGTREKVFDLPRYSFYWQRYYYLAEPLAVPRGTVAEFVGVWDNSAANLLNPDASVWCSWGQKTTDEMFGATIFYTPQRRMEEPLLIEDGRAVEVRAEADSPLS